MSNPKSISPRGRSEKTGRDPRSAPTGMFLQSDRSNSRQGALSIAIEPSVLKTLTARRTSIKAMMETLGRSIEDSRKSGVAGGFSVMIDAEGNPRIAPLASQVEFEIATKSAEQLDRALEAARERGRLRSSDILNGEEMLSAEAFAQRLGVSRVTVNVRRQKHELLALDGAKRGYRFPDWQVDETGKPIEALPRLFELLGDPWEIYRFLTQRHAALDGLTAKDALQRGRSEAVIATAEAMAQGAFA